MGEMVDFCREVCYYIKNYVYLYFRREHAGEKRGNYGQKK